MKTLEMLLREGTEILETAEIGEARLDAWLLLEKTGHIIMRIWIRRQKRGRKKHILSFAVKGLNTFLFSI